ncbi:MAG: hypothetical protein QM757_18890 [Paludibaculum sp.]
MKTLTTFFFLAVTAILPAQEQEAQPKAPGSLAVDAAVKQRLLAKLPSPLPREGKGDTPPSFYVSANLYEYMDGGADIYLLYDVETLLHWDLHTSAGDLTLDIFDMGTPESAFGMFSAESAPTYDFFSLGTAAYRNEGIVNFAQDRYYVKLAAFGESSATLLNEYARAISVRIGGTSEPPVLIRRLPAKGRTQHSEQYIRKDPMGHPFLAPVYQARYGDSTVMISVGKDAADATARMRQLGEHFSRSGTWERAGDRAMRGRNSYEGTIIASVSGRFVVILVNPAVGSESLLTETLQAVESGGAQ